MDKPRVHGQTSCFDYIRSLSLYAGHSAFCANQGMGHLFTRVSGHAHCWVRFLPSATWFSFTCSREADHGIYCSPDTEMWTTSPLNRHKCSFRGGSTMIKSPAIRHAVTSWVLSWITYYLYLKDHFFPGFISVHSFVKWIYVITSCSLWWTVGPWLCIRRLHIPMSSRSHPLRDTRLGL